MEIEAKYKALDEGFAGLLEIDKLGSYGLGKIKEQLLIDRYMDTANHDMLKAGYALRIREKNGRYLATVKGLSDSEGAIHRREEYETEIQPDAMPQDWSNCRARDLTLSIIHSRPLVEMFAINQFRRIRPVWQDKRLIGEMSLDIVDMKLGGKPSRFYEVEVELEKDGILGDLKKLDCMIKDRGLHPETRSKFHRAMEKIGIKL